MYDHVFLHLPKGEPLRQLYVKTAEYRFQLTKKYLESSGLPPEDVERLINGILAENGGEKEAEKRKK